MRLTSNQVRILADLAKGHPPTGFTNKGIQSLVKRGLVTTAMGTYRVNRRSSSGPFKVRRLTEAGLEALREEIERRYRSAIRAAESEHKADLRLLTSAETA